MTREFSKEEHARRITWLIGMRAVLTTLVVGALIVFQLSYRIYSFSTVILYYVLGAVYALTIVYLSLRNRFQDHRFFAYLQTSIDILLVTYLVRLTGGIDSGLSLLYHLTIISASIVLYRRGGYLAASLAGILYGAMLDLQYFDMGGLVRSQNYTAGQVFYQVFVNIVSFYMVALLSSYLSERLRSTRQQLHEKSMDFDDLRVLQEHVLRSVGSGILTMDLEGGITSWNPAAELITGYGDDEIRAKWQAVFGNSIKELFGRTDVLKERPLRFDQQIEKRDGATAILSMVASLLKDDANAVRGIIFTFQDITKLVEMEDRVRRQERLATVGSLAAGIAHEIRNPLASLSGSIQLLQADLALQGDHKRLMDIVVREADRLNEIVTEFLEYARPKGPHRDTIDLAALLEETTSLLQNSRPVPPGLRIIREVDPAIRIRGDARRCSQVFWNLLLNACQAMPNGGLITISAALQERENGHWCEIVIADEGTGIAGDLQDKIFDPFFTTKTGGTGLGLSIVYRIVEDHGGTIAVVGRSGAGARFTISLPALETASVPAGEGAVVRPD